MVGWHHRLNGWVWVNSGSWWGTGRPGVLQSMGSQRVRHDWATELNWLMGSDAMILVFWMLSFKPTFSLSSFSFMKRLFSSSSLFAIRVVSSAYLKLLVFLPTILIPAWVGINNFMLIILQKYNLYVCYHSAIPDIVFCTTKQNKAVWRFMGEYYSYFIKEE